MVSGGPNKNSLTQHEENIEGREDIKDSSKGESQISNSETRGFKELYEKSLQSVHMGEIVVGRVVQITPDVVMVDVGWKTEGYIPIREVKDGKGNITVSEGDQIEVLVDRRDSEGNLVLSREKVVRLRIWDEVKKACEEKLEIRGKITGKIKGGFSVDIGVPAFLPGSQLDIRPVKDLDRYIGQTLTFHVLKYDRKRKNVVLSRKEVLEKEIEKKRKATLESLEVGKIVEGVVKNVTDYGVFIDLGGVDGLLHVTDISWGRVNRPADVFNKGDKVVVKVLSLDREKERVSLGLKQLTEDPWSNVQEKYPVGSVVDGKVVNIMDYGAFVELEPGVEGLVHISEMFWSKDIRHPSKILKIGENVKVKVLEVNREGKRISLGLKQTMPNPWAILKEKYPEGSIIKGVVRNVTNFGVFVGVEEGIDGLIHISDISWKPKIKHPGEMFKKGQVVEAMVLGVDVENEKFSLGIKQMQKNPWEEFAEKYPPGSVISGKITSITDFGVFVEIEEGIEGLIHISELSPRRVKSAADIYSVGDTVAAVVKSIDLQNRKIRLSIKDYELTVEGSLVKQYLNNKEHVGQNLGKVLSEVKIVDTKR